MLRTVAYAAAALATFIGVAACGGSSSPNSGGTASRATGNSVALKLAHCMRTHGVADFPDPSAGGGFGIQATGGGGGSVAVDGHTLDVSGPAFQRAMRQCQRYQPQGPPISSAQLARIRQGALKMARCMRAHGVANFPDPRVTSGPGGHGIAVQIGGPAFAGGGARLDPTAPTFRSAQRVCMPLMRVELRAPAPGG